MFDLFRSRDKAVRLMLGGLLVVVAASMLTYLIPNYGGGSGPGDMVVAEIGKDEVVTMPEVQQLLQRQLRSRDVPPALVPHLVPQVIESIITERAVAYEAHRLGFRVTDDDVANTIRNIIPNLFPGGKFVGTETYAAMLAQQNTTIAEFERDLKRQILAGRLRDLVLQGTIVSPPEVEQEYRMRNEKVKVEYVKLSPETFRSQVSVTPAELQEYHKSHAALYQTPEQRSLAVLVLDQAKMEQSLKPADADLERMYNQDKERFRVPERIKVRHLLLKTTGDAAQDAAVKTKAEDLLKKIKGGANFAALAKSNSEDTASATKGGELPDWVQRGQTVAEFEQAAFGMQPGKISELVKTQYGYHIIQLIAKEAAHMQTLAEVKDQLAGEWSKSRVGEMVQQTLDRAAAALAKDPLHPEKVAAEFGLQLVRVERYGAGDTVPEVGASPDFDQAVASLGKGEASQAVAVSATKAVLASCLDVYPAHPSTFAEVESKVRDALVGEKVTRLMGVKATELFQKASSMQGDLKQAAQSMGLAVKVSEEFDRQGAVEGVGPASMFQDAFNKQPGALLGPLAVSDARVVAKLISRSPADMAKFAAERDGVRQEIKNRKIRERTALFESGLRQTLIRDGKIKIHQDVVNRMTANYRG